MKIPANGFKNASPGSHDARLLRVVDLGSCMESFQGQPPKLRHQVVLTFELLDEYTDSGDPLLAMIWFTLSLAPQSNMRPFFEAWLERKFSKEEIERFSFEPFLGKACEVFMVAENERVNIKSVVKAKPQKNYPALVNTPFIFDLDNPDPATFARLGEKTRNKILESEEGKPIQYKLLAGVDASHLGKGNGSVSKNDPEDIPFGDPNPPKAGIAQNHQRQTLAPVKNDNDIDF